jgi:hypothetical protein
VLFRPARHLLGFGGLRRIGCRYRRGRHGDERVARHINVPEHHDAGGGRHHFDLRGQHRIGNGRIHRGIHVRARVDGHQQ